MKTTSEQLFFDDLFPTSGRTESRKSLTNSDNRSVLPSSSQFFPKSGRGGVLRDVLFPIRVGPPQGGPPTGSARHGLPEEQKRLDTAWFAAEETLTQHGSLTVGELAENIGLKADLEPISATWVINTWVTRMWLESGEASFTRLDEARMLSPLVPNPKDPTADLTWPRARTRRVVWLP